MNHTTRTLIAAAALVALSAPAFAQFAGNQDQNRDGEITRDEAEAFARLRFDNADANQDGVLSLAEVEAAASTNFDRLDANGDDKVTRTELRKVFMARR